MSTLILLRHGLTAMTGPVLAGHTPGLHLDDRGQAQARSLALRLGPVPLTAIVTSPLDRCVDTAESVLAVQREVGNQPAWHVEDRIVECRYGDWTGKAIKDLAKEPMWKVVQQQPSAAVFPGGEALHDIQARAVQAVREWDQNLGADAVWVACSHGDVIKAVVADALGTHLDQFQRIVIDPCSVSIIRYTDARPFVIKVNDTGSELAFLKPVKRRGRRRATADATVGGGTGAGSV